MLLGMYIVIKTTTIHFLVPNNVQEPPQICIDYDFDKLVGHGSFNYNAGTSIIMDELVQKLMSVIWSCPLLGGFIIA